MPETISQDKKGKLIFLTTPIGNLDDITIRVKQALEQGQYFFAEDTRRLYKLFDLLGIAKDQKKIECYNDYSDELVLKKIAKLLDLGENIYYSSDAGSPLLSDPGHGLIKRLNLSSDNIDTYPGANAVVTALELSGFPSTKFTFHGFFSREKNDKMTCLKNLSNGTHIFYESPHRLSQTLKLLKEFFPEYNICLARELTKKYQNIYHFKASEFNEAGKNDFPIKGEFVLLITLENKLTKKGSEISDKLIELVKEAVENNNTAKIQSKVYGEILGLSNKEIYQKLISQKK